MNVIGILKEYDPNFTCAKELKELLTTPMTKKEYNEQLIAYLKQGVHTFKFLTSDDDADGTPIGQRKYLTDGEWIWPSYYVYYVEKYPNIAVPQIFIDHVNTKKTVPNLSTEDKLYAEYMTAILLEIRIPKNLESLKKVRPLIETRGEEIVCY